MAANLQGMEAPHDDESCLAEHSLPENKMASERLLPPSDGTTDQINAAVYKIKKYQDKRFAINERVQSVLISFESMTYTLALA